MKSVPGVWRKGGGMDGLNFLAAPRARRNQINTDTEVGVDNSPQIASRHCQHRPHTLINVLIYPSRFVHHLKRNTDGKWESHPFLDTSVNAKSPKLSPDGRYVAYLSDESGRNELYVRPFPAGGRKWPISSGGAMQIRWSRRSGELFYTEARTLIAVSVRTTPQFAVRATTRLFSYRGFSDTIDSNYDVSPDGRRIILPEKVGIEEPTIRAVQDWFAEFRERR